MRMQYRRSPLRMRMGALSIRRLSASWRPPSRLSRRNTKSSNVWILFCSCLCFFACSACYCIIVIFFFLSFSLFGVTIFVILTFSHVPGLVLWSVDDVVKWLGSAGFSEFQSLAKENAIDGSALVSIDSLVCFWIDIVSLWFLMCLFSILCLLFFHWLLSFFADS
jgi:hypothetical protein